MGVLGFPPGTFVRLLPVSELFSFVPLDCLNYTRYFCVIQSTDCTNIPCIYRAIFTLAFRVFSCYNADSGKDGLLKIAPAQERSGQLCQ